MFQQSEKPCVVCDGMGVVLKDVPFGHPDYGKTFPCPACTIYEDQRQASIIRMSHLDDYADQNFDTFETNLAYLMDQQRASLTAAYNTAMSYAQNPEGWLVMRGSPGTGKTHLAAAIGHECVAKSIRTIFVTAPDFLDHLRATYSPQSDISYDQQFERLLNIELLILDDLGSESPTAWAREKLYQLLNYRYNKKLMTVVTTNIDLNLIDERLASRLQDRHLVQEIAFALPDYRRAGDISNDPLIYDLSNLKHYQELRFENFYTENTELRRHVEVARHFAESPEGWILIAGGHGAGKTHLAAAIANQWSRIHHTQTALMVTTADLLDYLREAFEPSTNTSIGSRFKAIRQCPLLVLEDFRIPPKVTSWSRDKLFQLIDYRYLAHLPTVLTINTQSLKEIEQNHPDFQSRFSDGTIMRWIVLDNYDRRHTRGRSNQ